MQLPVLNSFGTSRLENVNISSKNAELTGENLFLQEIDGDLLLEEGISEGCRHVVRIQRALLDIVLEVSKDTRVSSKLYCKQGCAKSKFFSFILPSTLAYHFVLLSSLKFRISEFFEVLEKTKKSEIDDTLERGGEGSE